MGYGRARDRSRKSGAWNRHFGARRVRRSFRLPVAGVRRLPIAQPFASFWRARKIWLAFVSVACAAYGQWTLVEKHDVVSSIRWYALGIILLIVAWAGSYRNKTFLQSTRSSLPGAESDDASGGTASRLSRLREPENRSMALRYLLAAAALGLNIASVMILRADYEVVPGGVGWLASVILLALAFVGQRPRALAAPLADPDNGPPDAEERTA